MRYWSRARPCQRSRHRRGPHLRTRRQWTPASELHRRRRGATVAHRTCRRSDAARGDRAWRHRGGRARHRQDQAEVAAITDDTPPAPRHARREAGARSRGDPVARKRPVSEDGFASIILDVDSTLCGVEGIDWLPAARGADVSERVEELTRRAMAREVALDSVYGERLPRPAPPWGTGSPPPGGYRA